MRRIPGTPLGGGNRNPLRDGRMPQSGTKAINTSPRYNNSMAAGRRKGPNFKPMGTPGMATGERDYFGELNSFQPDISGEQPGPIQKGWGGAGGDLGTMGMTKVNSWLNTFQDPTERAQAMNGIGYFNQGNPYTPQAAKGVNRGYRGYAQENQQTGGYSSPGTYLHQSGGYGAGPGVAPDMNFGGYIGATTVGTNGAAQYNPFDINRQQGGGKQMPMNSPGGLPGPGGRPIGGGGGGKAALGPPGPVARRNQPGRPGPGGGGGGNNGPGNQPGGQGGRPGVNQGGMYANFPAPQKAPPAFLPMTPQFEAGRRGLFDEYQGQQMELLNQQSMVQPMYDQQKARMDTDMGFDIDRLKEQLAARGVYTPYSGEHTALNPQMAEGPAGGGIGQSLYNRDIQIPYGRNYSDLGTAAAGAYGDIASQLSGLNLNYNQGMAELLLNRAADAASNIPMNVPQYSVGGRVLRGQRYNNKPKGRNRGKRK